MRIATRLFAALLGALVAGALYTGVYWSQAASRCAPPPGTCVIPLERFVVLAPLLMVLGAAVAVVLEAVRYRWAHGSAAP